MLETSLMPILIQLANAGPQALPDRKLPSLLKEDDEDMQVGTCSPTLEVSLMESCLE